ncbi:N-acetylmuramoyl-L-alanine amidase family protein [Brevibacillus massiliensis]|jgi:N-acetylmuramoyl-L-alanine amidase|uniref:N-acetylmuramoyl-L-alanine amidase family protein n=1 Tax=Brevibacillus massiliensis TaxID=1118054 RepID=UPI00031FC073|nr:N-acetylmuramoyl-L-alanine amidase family protein [Brevibacillus massiliensis]
MRKYVAPLFVFLSLLFIIPGMTAAASGSGTDQIRLMIEGNLVQPEVPPIMQNDRTLVPIRVIAEGLGAEVDWDQDSFTATVNKGNHQLVLRLNQKQATVNGKTVQLDAPPLLHKDRMLLPLRFVGEALGSTVGWDNESQTVVVNQPISLQINGLNVTSTMKSYKWDGQLYLPVGKIAEQLGTVLDVKKLSSRKTIDSVVAASLAEVQELLGAKIDWDKERNSVKVERVSRLDAIVVDGEKVRLAIDKPGTPKTFTLTDPRRIVIDLPNTILSDELEDGLQADGLGVAYQAGKNDAAPAADSAETATSYEAGQAVQQTAGTTANPALPPLIKSIRYSQYSDAPYTVRVVLELDRKATYKLEQNDDGLGIALFGKSGFLIVVDAGHGGHDSGALGIAGNKEKDYNLAVANRVVELLKQYPEFQVVATRSTDVFLELKERVQIANDYDADVFLSIHANSFQPQTRGTETYYYNANSKQLAEIVHRHLVGATQFPDRGVHTSGFYVIKNTKMPAVLTETGFLTNSVENAKLVDPKFQDQVARALVAAIREYYEKNK